MTFAIELEQAAGGKDKIRAVVIGNDGWDGYKRTAPEDIANKVQDWQTARTILDYAYDDGYGAPDCHSVYVWTDDAVLFVSQYDGATHIVSIPRNPTDGAPEMPGG